MEVAAAFDAESRNGALKRVSPPEEFFAFLKRMDKDLNKAADLSGKDTPRACNKVVLEVPCEFLVLPTRSDMWWQAHDARERIGSQFRMVCQTTYQRVRGVLRVFHDDMES